MAAVHLLHCSSGRDLDQAVEDFTAVNRRCCEGHGYVGGIVAVILGLDQDVISIIFFSVYALASGFGFSTGRIIGRICSGHTKNQASLC